MGVKIVTSLPTVTRNREIGDSSASWQLRRPSPGHGRLPRILGGQETHLLVSGNKRNRRTRIDSISTCTAWIYEYNQCFNEYQESVLVRMMEMPSYFHLLPDILSGS